jgi:hypothetical protein
MAHLTPLQADELKMRVALSTAFDTWAVIEHELSLLLQSMINDEYGFVGRAIYYAPASTETRIAIVDKALVAAMLNRPYGQAVIASWVKVLKLLDRKRSTRNKLAHWFTSEVIVNGSGPHFRLVPPYEHHLPGGLDIAKSRQIPGMSAHDISSFDKGLRQVLGSIRLLRDVIKNLLEMKVDSFAAQQPFLQKFHELADRLNLEASAQIQWPPKL